MGEFESDSDAAIERRSKLAGTLAKSGYHDILVVSQEAGGKLLTERRRELLKHLRTADPESGRDIAEALDRDPAMISKDLDVFFRYDIIEFELNGSSKKPVLKHNHVVVEPLV